MTEREARLYRALFREAAAAIDEGAMREVAADLHLDGQAELVAAVAARACRRMRAMLLAEAEAPRELADLAAALMALDAGEHRALARHIADQAGGDAGFYGLARPAIELTAAMLDLLGALGVAADEAAEGLTPKVLHA